MAQVIRQAYPGEEEVIYGLICELAEYEKARDKVKTTPAQILEELEKESPLFGCLLALESRQPVGFALYYYTFSTWVGRSMHLEDLYVQPSHRGTGIGKSLLQQLVLICQTENLKRLDWEVLEWNSRAHAFYESVGAHCRSDWRSWRLEF